MNIYHYRDYRLYLKTILPVSGIKRGSRANLAKALNVQTSFISRVLANHSDFSFEQSILINEHLNHDLDESDFFILLIHYSRAGSDKLKNYFLKKIINIQNSKQKIEKNIKNEINFTNEVKYIFYSNWIYSYLFLAIRIKKLNNRKNLFEHLSLPKETIENALNWLIKENFIYEKDYHFYPSIHLIHLEENASMLGTYHSQWRRIALNNFERNKQSNLFLTSPITVSKNDFSKIKNLLLDFIKKTDEILIPSNDEILCCLNIDFFEVNE